VIETKYFFMKLQRVLLAGILLTSAHIGFAQTTDSAAKAVPAAEKVAEKPAMVTTEHAAKKEVVKKSLNQPAEAAAVEAKEVAKPKVEAARKAKKEAKKVKKEGVEKVEEVKKEGAKMEEPKKD
jgi:hypothetical protein